MTATAVVELTAFSTCLCTHSRRRHDSTGCRAGGCGCAVFRIGAATGQGPDTQEGATASGRGLGIRATEMCERAGISYRQLDYWTRGGMLHAIGDATPGFGSPRYYTDAEAKVATTARRLIDVGFGANYALTYARQLVESGEPLILADNLVLIEVDSLR